MKKKIYMVGSLCFLVSLMITGFISKNQDIRNRATDASFVNVPKRLAVFPSSSSDFDVLIMVNGVEDKSYVLQLVNSGKDVFGYIDLNKVSDVTEVDKWLTTGVNGIMFDNYTEPQSPFVDHAHAIGLNVAVGGNVTDGVVVMPPSLKPGDYFVPDTTWKYTNGAMAWYVGSKVIGKGATGPTNTPAQKPTITPAKPSPTGKYPTSTPRQFPSPTYAQKPTSTPAKQATPTPKVPKKPTSTPAKPKDCPPHKHGENFCSGNTIMQCSNGAVFTIHQCTDTQQCIGDSCEKKPKDCDLNSPHGTVTCQDMRYLIVCNDGNWVRVADCGQEKCERRWCE